MPPYLIIHINTAFRLLRIVRLHFPRGQHRERQSFDNQPFQNMSPSLPITPRFRNEAATTTIDPEALAGIELEAPHKANDGRNDPYLICFEEPFDADK